MFFHLFTWYFTSLWINANCVSPEYFDELMQRIVELCTKSRPDRPEPLRSHPLLRQEWRGHIRNKLSMNMADASKARMMASNSVTLAVCEILHNLAMDTLLESWGQHREAQEHECPFSDNSRSLARWQYAVYPWHLHKRAPKRIALLVQKYNTERTPHRHNWPI